MSVSFLNLEGTKTKVKRLYTAGQDRYQVKFLYVFAHSLLTEEFRESFTFFHRIWAKHPLNAQIRQNREHEDFERGAAFEKFAVVRGKGPRQRNKEITFDFVRYSHRKRTADWIVMQYRDRYIVFLEIFTNTSILRTT